MKAKGIGLILVLSVLVVASGMQVGLAQPDPPGPNEGMTVTDGCMQDIAGFGLNCSANDVQVARMVGDAVITDPCEYPGDYVTFTATFEVILTAQARHDIGIYFATDGDPNSDGAISGSCSISTVPYYPDYPDGVWLDLDGTFDPYPGDNKPSGQQDYCGDIDDGHNPLYPEITITTQCIDTDGDGWLNLPYCTGWRQSGSNYLCQSPLDAYPGAPSKCKCDTGFEVEVPVPSAALTVVKTATPTQVYEPGQVVRFDVSVQNTGTDPNNDVTLTSLTDVPYGDITTVHGDIESTTCSVPQTIPWGLDGKYECYFTAWVYGNAGDEKTDTVTASGYDSRTPPNPVTGSDSATVTVLDVSTPLTAVKSTSTPMLEEPGGEFQFSVVIANPSTFDAATISAIQDTFLDVDLNGTCVDADGAAVSFPYTLAPEESITCGFTVNHESDYPQCWQNTVAVTAIDEDSVDVSTTSNEVEVCLTDVPAVMLDVTKAAEFYSLPEPGGLFNFTADITNPSAVDTATISSITDTYGTPACEDADGNAITLPYDLVPGETIYCSFSFEHTGNAYDEWTNVVSVAATDDDGADVGADSNPVTVSLTDIWAPLTAVKSTSTPTLEEPGGDFQFSVVIANPSTLDAATISAIQDTFLDVDLNGTCVDSDYEQVGFPYTLAPGEAIRCDFTVNHLEDYPYSWTNSVAVTATDEDGVDVSTTSNEVTVSLTDAPPAATLTKTATEVVVKFVVVVTNTGASTDPLTINSLTDDPYGDITSVHGDIRSTNCATGAVLETGESYSCYFTAVVSESPQTDTVTAGASDDEGNPIYPWDDATVSFTLE